MGRPRRGHARPSAAAGLAAEPTFDQGLHSLVPPRLIVTTDPLASTTTNRSVAGGDGIEHGQRLGRRSMWVRAYYLDLAPWEAQEQDRGGDVLLFWAWSSSAAASTAGVVDAQAGGGAKLMITSSPTPSRSVVRASSTVVGLDLRAAGPLEPGGPANSPSPRRCFTSGESGSRRSSFSNRTTHLGGDRTGEAVVGVGVHLVVALHARKRPLEEAGDGGGPLPGRALGLIECARL